MDVVPIVHVAIYKITTGVVRRSLLRMRGRRSDMQTIFRDHHHGVVQLTRIRVVVQ